MHMLNILANITDQNLASQFLNDTQFNQTKEIREYQAEKERQYLDKTSPLLGAQKAADNYMLLKQRKPMVIEYYKKKPTNASKDFISSVEMYINPQRLSIQYQKVKGKAYTRGGIFYHHWGDDNPTMVLGGTVGLSGMKGIEQLEKIYLNSGAVLRYGEMDLIKVSGSNNSSYENIDFNDPAGVLDHVIANPNSVVIDTALEGINKKINEVTKLSDKVNYQITREVLLNYKNLMSQAKYQSEYSEITSKITEYSEQIKNNEDGRNVMQQLYEFTLSKINSSTSIFVNLHDSIKTVLAFEMVLPYVDSENNNDSLLKSLDDGTIKKTKEIATNQASQVSEYIKLVHASNESWKINREDAFEGWADIADEIFDEWRPRLIFIYFEDRVYIGHFDNFSYQRVAESPLINYEMRFTIVRQIVITANQDNSAKKNAASVSRTSFIQNFNNSNNEVYETANKIEFFKQNPNDAYIELLRLEDMITHDDALYRSSISHITYLQPLTQDQRHKYEQLANDLRGFVIDNFKNNQNLSEGQRNWYIDMCSDNALDAEQRMAWWRFIADAPTNNAKMAATMSFKKEIDRTKEVFLYETSLGKMTDARKNQIIRWVTQVRENISDVPEISNYNKWEDNYK